MSEFHRLSEFHRDCQSSIETVRVPTETVRVPQRLSGFTETVRVPQRLSGFHRDSQGSIETVRVPIETVRIPIEVLHSKQCDAVLVLLGLLCL